MTDALIHQHVDELCSLARPAGRECAKASDATRVTALRAAADAILTASDTILAANALDMAAADENALSDAMKDRLRLDADRLQAIANDVRGVAEQRDPVGRVLEERGIVQELQLQKVSVPIGVICIIFESRPNVTVDAAALCVRSGNACILRGGKEAVHSNRALAQAFSQGLDAAGLPPAVVQLVQEQDRALVPELLSRDKDIDLVVPRGGEGLIQAVVAVSKIPVVKHDKGVCSMYVHSAANQQMALELILNAKCQRPGVCNAIENVVVDAAIAPAFLPILDAALEEAGVTIHADEQACALMPNADLADDAAWGTEYLALELAVKVVADLAEAVNFTNTYGSGHSDCIISDDQAAAAQYVHEVDAAAVYHNASTRFTDGSQFGLGAEVGISTNRLHARGPMGADDLCTYKFVVRGVGQVR